MHFLEEAQPFRALQHPALMQCLAQCTEVTPYLLVMEFCPLGDVKGYLRSCRTADTMTPEPLILQRMACDIASGLLHLHKHNVTLRNCLLTADVSVKIGDYGLSHTKYKDDYYVTLDQMYVPLRWIAPELVDEVHGNLLVADQTQQSNIWSLGVTIWELFELGNQPYRHYSDRQVLTYAVREQQLRLSKPLLKVPLAERWYEVMQFCWLQPDQRPNAEEVHLLLSYLCAKGASEAEEDFERRWNSMRPNTGNNSLRGACVMSRDHPSLTSSSSFPLLEQFSAGDGYHSESGDDILTVTETSHGLNFEYKWEHARAEQSYRAPDSSSTLGHHCQEAFYPPGGIVGGCPMESLSHGVSPPYYQPKHLHAPGVLPVLSAHSPSMSSEYYIRIEEPVDCNIDLDYTMCSYSPDYQGSSGSFLTGSADSGECMACPSQAKNMASYWSADIHKSDVYDSNDSSPAISLTMEPLLGQVSDSSPIRPWESSHYVSYKDRDGGYYYEHSPPLDHYLIGGELSSERHHQESWGSRSLRQALGELENPLGISPVISPPQQAYRDVYLDTSQASIIGKNVTGGYYDMMGSLRKTMPSHTRHNSHSVSINMETEGALFIGHRDSDSEEEEEEDIFVERHTCNTWPSKHRHSSVGHHRRASHSCRQDAYVDFHYTMPSTDIEDSWPEEHSLAFHALPKPIDYLEPHQAKDNSACLNLSKHHAMVPSDNCNAYIYLCHEGETQVPVSGECCHSHFVDPLTGLLVRNNSYSHSYSHSNYIRDKVINIPSNEEMINLSPAPGGPIVPKPALIKTEDSGEQYVDLTADDPLFKEKREDVIKENLIMQKPTEPKIEEATPIMTKATPPPDDNMHVMVALADPQSETSNAGDSGVDRGGSSVSLADILDCSDDDENDDITDDITDFTSGIFADESGELNASPAFKSLQKQVGTPDSMDSMDLPSAAGSCEGFSPASSHPSSSPKAMDSGYDTENNESPEFVPKEPHEPRDQPLGKPTLDTSLEEDEEHEVDAQEVPTEAEPSLDEDLDLGASQTCNNILLPLSDKTPYRDSAYFSDYENERLSKDEGEELSEEVKDEENVENEQHMAEKKGEKRKNEEDEDLQDTVVSKDIKLEINALTQGAETSYLPEFEACLPEQCDSDEMLGLSLEPSDTTSIVEGGLDEWPSQEESSSLGDWAAEVVGAMEEALGALNEECKSNISVEEEEAEDTKDSETADEPAIKTVQYKPSGISGEVLHSLPKDEVALQHTANSRRFSSSSPPPPSTPPPQLPATEGRGSPADGEDGDEEDANTDDSDESDEDLRTYSVQEQSGGEESEDECHPVPIVVSDNSEAHKLRSLLKMPTNLEEEVERKKKTVSFFDDVTVYLFDQESPTKELAERGFPSGAEGQSSQSKDGVNPSDDSSDGNISEESAGYEWDDDFPLLPLPTSSVTSDSPPPRSISKAPDPKPAMQYSRFTVSRFSITHISDSDMDSAGGSSEDGDKE
ncbi:hypothetical protein PAMA_012100 [Pampus argenteus]